MEADVNYRLDVKAAPMPPVAPHDEKGCPLPLCPQVSSGGLLCQQTKICLLSPQLQAPAHRLSPQLQALAHRLSPQLQAPTYRLSPQLQAPTHRLSPQLQAPPYQLSPQLQVLACLLSLQLQGLAQVALQLPGLSLGQDRDQADHHLQVDQVDSAPQRAQGNRLLQAPHHQAARLSTRLVKAEPLQAAHLTSGPAWWQMRFSRSLCQELHHVSGLWPQPRHGCVSWNRGRGPL